MCTLDAMEVTLIKVGLNVNVGAFILVSAPAVTDSSLISVDSSSMSRKHPETVD